MRQEAVIKVYWLRQSSSKLLEGFQVSIDPETFRQMFAASEPQTPDEHAEFEEPPIHDELIEPPIQGEEPPIQFEEPPPSEEELEAAAAEELLKIAAEDEQEVQKVRKALRSKDTFVIHCPKGCRIRVKESHRGKSGKCPRCQSEFVVPKKPGPKNT